MLYFFKKKFKTYIKFLPSYLFATFFAFIFDILTYTTLKPLLGINLSAFLSFTGSQVILFSILRIRLQSKINRKRYAFPIQILIGIITLIIHIIALNLLAFFILNSEIILLKEFFKNQTLYNSSSKIFAALLGFFWTSMMTRKFVFTSNNY